MKHILNPVVGLMSTLAVALLCGCGKSQPTPPAPTAVNPASLMYPPKAVSSQGLGPAPRPALPKPDPDVRESSYVDLNREPQGQVLTYLIVSLRQSCMN